MTSTQAEWVSWMWSSGRVKGDIFTTGRAVSDLPLQAKPSKDSGHAGAITKEGRWEVFTLRVERRRACRGCKVMATRPLENAGHGEGEGGEVGVGAGVGASHMPSSEASWTKGEEALSHGDRACRRGGPAENFVDGRVYPFPVAAGDS